MYPKKKYNNSEKREKDKFNRREQMKTLLINKFKGKYTFGSANTDERNKIIAKEVSNLIETQICSEKNLLALDKKLEKMFEKDMSEKSHHSKGSRKSSHGSVVMSQKRSEKSRRSAIGRAGEVILSQERDMNKSYSHHEGSVPLYNRTSNLNRTNVTMRSADEWDNIIMNDVMKYEEEQKQLMLEKQKIKRQVMKDLNIQMNEKKKLKQKEKEAELELEKKRQSVQRKEERSMKNTEMIKCRKNKEERKIMESQIAEMDKIKRLGKQNERIRAKVEKDQASKALEEDKNRELQKRKEYQEICQLQYKENLELKEYMKKQEEEKRKKETIRKHDIFGDMFEVKKHVSYELAAKNQK